MKMTSQSVPCFLCYRLCKYPSTCKSKQKGSSFSLNDQLGVVFLFQNILKIPKSFCENLLVKRGNPSEWIIYCKECSKFIVKGQKIFERMMNLKNECSALESKISEILQNSKHIAITSEIKPIPAVIDIVTTIDEIRKLILKAGPAKAKDVSSISREIQNIINRESEVGLPFDELQIKCEDESQSVVPQELEETNFWDYSNNDSNSILPNEIVPDNICLNDLNAQPKTQSSRPERKIRKQTQRKQYKETHTESDSEVSFQGNAKDSDWEIGSDSDRESEAHLSANEHEDKEVRKDPEQLNILGANVGSTINKRKKSNRKARKVLTRKRKSSKESTENLDSKSEDRVKLTCEICQGLYSSKQTLRNHVYEIHKALEYKFFCEWCGKGFKLRSEMRIHQKDIHPQLLPPPLEKKTCPFCNKLFFGKHLKGHIDSKHSDELKYICPVCNAGFTNKRRLDAHRYKEHKVDKPYKCDFCPKQFIHPNLRQTHEISAHTKEYEHICEFCGKGFASGSYLKVHAESHTAEGANKFPCEICGLGFWLKGHLQYHQRGKHWKELGLQPLKCNLCDKVFTHSKTLRIHKKREHDKDFTPCSICGRKFVDSYRLKKHIRIDHDGERPCKCDFCPQRFKTTRQLQDHVQLHTGYKFQCNICSKGFTNCSNLKAHLEVHSRNGQPKERKRKKLQEESLEFFNNLN